MPHSDSSSTSHVHRIRLPVSSSGRSRSTSRAPSAVSLTARRSIDRSMGACRGRISRYTPASESQVTLPACRFLAVWTVSLFQDSSTSPLAARRRMARRWDSAAARPVRSGGMIDGSSSSPGASSKIRRAHRPKRRPRRLASAADQDELETATLGDIPRVLHHGKSRPRSQHAPTHPPTPQARPPAIL
jgi:hypothetical protein